MSMWLEGLNPEQKEAVLHNAGPLLILAGAGSGKTTVLISRAGRLISEGLCKPEELLVLTFTNKAARELKSRVTEKVGRKGSKVWSGTFHSFGVNFLKEYGHHIGLPKRFAIVSQNDAQGILKDIIKNLSIYGKDNFDLSKLQSMMSDWAERGQWQAKEEDPYEELVEILLPKYEERLKELGAVDFDRLILYPIRILKEHGEIREEIRKRYPYAMIDEFQDTNRAQMDLVRLIVEEKDPNLAVVGDDDQSIYAWRGAEIKNILGFPRLFETCRTVKLIRNYRCNSAILNMANSIIRKNQTRHEKELIAERKEAPQKPEVFVYENDNEEANKTMMEIHRLLRQNVPAKDIALLYRSNSQGAFLESYLRKERIAYRISGNTAFFDRKEIRDILSFLHSALMPSDLHFRRILNVPARGIGLQSIEKIQHAEGSFYKNAKNWREIGVNEKAGYAIDQLIEELKKLRENIKKNTWTRTSIENFLDHIGYKSYIRKMAKDADHFGKQWVLVEVLFNILDSFQKQKPGIQGLEDFLDTMDLRDVDRKEKEEEIQLLTFHACKGLEFPYVFILGVEEELLPHARLGKNIDEERRLFYVAVTRAKTKLIMSYNKYRTRMGRLKRAAPSRFLLDIPQEDYLRFENGNRPLNEEERSSLVASFLSQFEK